MAAGRPWWTRRSSPRRPRASSFLAFRSTEAPAGEPRPWARMAEARKRAKQKAADGRRRGAAPGARGAAERPAETPWRPARPAGRPADGAEALPRRRSRLPRGRGQQAPRRRIELPASGLAEDILGTRRGSGLGRGPAAAPYPRRSRTPTAPSEPAARGHSISFFSAPAREERGRGRGHGAPRHLLPRPRGVRRGRAAGAGDQARHRDHPRAAGPRVHQGRHQPAGPHHSRSWTSRRSSAWERWRRPGRPHRGGQAPATACVGLLVDGASQVLKVPVSADRARPRRGGREGRRLHPRGGQARGSAHHPRGPADRSCAGRARARPRRRPHGERTVRGASP